MTMPALAALVQRARSLKQFLPFRIVARDMQGNACQMKSGKTSQALKIRKRSLTQALLQIPILGRITKG
ncbi:hypothetical protein THS27_08275 [Thalassospira sp. MCCC 1A01428]|nr:hypothetical protein THS27_08275 [Thalassospira sp. MCCC 1A01428]